MAGSGVRRAASATVAGLFLGALVIIGLDMRFPADLPPVVPVSLIESSSPSGEVQYVLQLPDELSPLTEPRLLVSGTADAVTLVQNGRVVDTTVLAAGDRKNPASGWILTLPGPLDAAAGSLALRLSGSSVPGRVGLGEASTLLPWALRWQEIWQRWPSGIAVALAISGLVCLGVHFLQRHSPAFAWGALAQLAWAANTAYFATDTVPIPLLLFWPLGWLTSALTTIGAWFFVRHATGRPRDGRTRAIALAAVLLAAALHGVIVVDLSTYLALGTYVLGPVLVAIGVTALAEAVRGTARGVPGAAGFTIALAATMVVGLRDTLVDFGMIESGTVRYLHFVAPLTMGVVLMMIISRFARAMDRAAALGARLETDVQRVAEAHEEQLRQRLDRERRLALKLERERLVREMHDGAGGHLVQALAMAERGADEAQVRAAIKACIDEISLISEPGSSPRDSLDGLLDRLRDRFQAAGLDFEFDVRSATGVLEAYPALLPDLQRIIQEGSTNVLRHADAKNVMLRLEGAPHGGLRLLLTDDGRGLNRAELRSGRGFSHLRRRADRLGGTLSIDSDDSGTRLRLDLPLASHETSEM